MLRQRNDKIEEMFQAATRILVDAESPGVELLDLDLSMALYQLGLSVKHDLCLEKGLYVNNAKGARKHLRDNEGLVSKMDTALQAGKKLRALFVESSESRAIVRAKAVAYKLEIRDFFQAARAEGRKDLFPLSASDNEFRLIVDLLKKSEPPIPALR